MLNHLVRFTDEAEARSVLVAYGKQTNLGWRWDESRVIPGQRVVIARAVWDRTDPMRPVVATPEQTLAGYYVTVSLNEISETLRDLPNAACRLIGDSAGHLVYVASGFDVNLLSTALIEPTPAGYAFKPILAAPEVQPDLAEAKHDGKIRINTAAGAARLKYITDAPGQAMTYDRKRREALQAIDDPSPTAQKYPVLAASIGVEVPATGNAKADFDAVCALIIARETEWAAAASQIEAARLNGLKQVAAAATPAQVAETVSPAETALAAL